MAKIPNFENSRWRMAAILKMVLSLYLSRKSSDLNEIWYADADCASKVGYLSKYQNFANSKWRTAAILKIVSWLYERRSKRVGTWHDNVKMSMHGMYQ